MDDPSANREQAKQYGSCPAGKPAEELFVRLSKGGIDVTPPGHSGRLVQLLGGGYIGYRRETRSGPPTIDVNIPGGRVRKLKFPGT